MLSTALQKAASAEFAYPTQYPGSLATSETVTTIKDNEVRDCDHVTDKPARDIDCISNKFTSTRDSSGPKVWEVTDGERRRREGT